MSPLRDLEALLTLSLAAHNAARSGQDYLPTLLDAQILLDDLVTPADRRRVVPPRTWSRHLLPAGTVAANLAGARAHLDARGGPDPEGHRRLRQLDDEVRSAGRRRRITSIPRSQETAA